MSNEIQLDHPGQLMFAGLPGSDVPGDLADAIRAGRVGGVILFARNVESPEQLRRLVDALHALAPPGAPLCIGVDQEGGRVQRLRAPWTEWPPARRLAEGGPPDRTRAAAAAIGTELADLGIDLDFAPVVDVDSNPDNPVIGDRSFSRDAGRVGRHAASFIEGLQSAGVAACAKHFPGHGDTDLDSHVALPRIALAPSRMAEVELPPFRAAVAAGVASVMTAHIVVEAIDAERPATLSPAVLRLLREEIGFDGLVFTDDLEMKAIADHYGPEEIVGGCLSAGVDALLVCSDPELRVGIGRALEAAPHSRVDASLRRLTAFKARWSGGRRRRPGVGPPYSEHVALARSLEGLA